MSANKYTPHQGAQERLRRQVGGWAWHRLQGDFYDPAMPPATKRGTLVSEWGKQQIKKLKGESL